MTLDDLERPKGHSSEIKYFYGARHNNLNEDRSMLSAAKMYSCVCRPMILVARNIKYMRIFAVVPSERGRQVQ